MWSFDQVLPYFKRAETKTRRANEWHGNSGPITVKPSRVDLPICEAFLAAAGEARFAVVDDLNADYRRGLSACYVSNQDCRRTACQFRARWLAGQSPAAPEAAQVLV